VDTDHGTISTAPLESLKYRFMFCQMSKKLVCRPIQEAGVLQFLGCSWKSHFLTTRQKVIYQTITLGDSVSGNPRFNNSGPGRTRGFDGGRRLFNGRRFDGDFRNGGGRSVHNRSPAANLHQSHSRYSNEYPRPSQTNRSNGHYHETQDNRTFNQKREVIQGDFTQNLDNSFNSMNPIQVYFLF
jgi:hypothetical protein